ncbi:uncharacterized protein [Haliotis asinina]|uniref:uncharacterized protein n=1 Tax=Haliotis asinina TaxID=109174 RepID=UPI003531AEE3
MYLQEVVTPVSLVDVYREVVTPVVTPISLVDVYKEVVTPHRTNVKVNGTTEMLASDIRPLY